MNAAPVSLSKLDQEQTAHSAGRWSTTPARELRLTQYCTLFGALAMLLALWGLVQLIANRIHLGRYGLAAADITFTVAVVFLMWGTLFHQVTRWAFFKRLLKHRRATDDELEAVYDDDRPHPLAILVPSYKEELRVIRMTLMSAALTEYPDRRVVLLIDDPPNPAAPQDARDLAATRALVRELNATFRARQRRFQSALEAFQRRQAAQKLSYPVEFRRLAKLYREAAAWLEGQASAHQIVDHYDDLFVKRVLREPARAHRGRAAALQRLSSDDDGTRLYREYRRLAALFAVPMTSFERKRYTNLSHASNKAMNLNSYIALLGRNYHEVIRGGALHLEECDAEQAELRVRDADYIITLDADSLLLGDYALQLTRIMNQPESARFAVVQTPFSAVPNTTSLLERVAGAQTDVQWFGTQGATLFNSSFWVGANALLRHSALEDICEIVYERGFPIRRYLHDRTVVEDTESTIDLMMCGWQVYCHPERLSYSATPPDFGALVIQRRRWANGPLLIVPKLIRHALAGSNRVRRLPEFLIRLYTLTSAMGAIAMLLTIVAPFPDAKRLPVVWLIFSVIPYYVLYCRDLQACGFEWWDLPRVYGMNLILITVNLTGMVKSLRQAVTGARSAFTRTPKVPGRTAAPPIQIILPALILPCVLISCVRLLARSEWAYSAYGLTNLVCLGYAFYSYIGVRAACEDIAASVALRFEGAAASVRQLRGNLPAAHAPVFAASASGDRVSASAN
jgi:cellulose synthase (UDP-forming)